MLASVANRVEIGRDYQSADRPAVLAMIILMNTDITTMYRLLRQPCTSTVVALSVGKIAPARLLVKTVHAAA
jgi:hypothetical protein